MKTEGMEFLLDIIIEEGLHSNRDNLRFHLDTLFEGIDFRNKNVLDIGGGGGLYSFYAACRGSEKVVCLEPEARGSSFMVTEKFRKVSRRLKYSNVTHKPITLQGLEPHGEMFDILLLHNSINHLDEAACVSLLKSDSSRVIYHEIFSKINSLSNKGAKVIVCDCSRYNFFSFLGIRNPMVPNIEWHKHQAPEVWACFLGDVGFKNPKIRWSSFNRLRHWGKVFLGNRLMAYFLDSHFCLTMEKP